MTDALQLLLYRFAADARFEGRLVGALERMESGDTLRIVEALFVARDAETGELAAVDLRSRGAGSLVEPLIGFRLDEHQRRRTTEKALAAGGDTAARAGRRPDAGHRDRGGARRAPLGACARRRGGGLGRHGALERVRGGRHAGGRRAAADRRGPRPESHRRNDLTQSGRAA